MIFRCLIDDGIDTVLFVLSFFQVFETKTGDRGGFAFESQHRTIAKGFIPSPTENLLDAFDLLSRFACLIQK